MPSADEALGAGGSVLATVGAGLALSTGAGTTTTTLAALGTGGPGV